MISNWMIIFILAALATLAYWQEFYELIQGSKRFSLNHFTISRSALRDIIHVFDTEPNCGLQQPCPSNSFSIFLSTGFSSFSKPSLCIGGKHLMKPMMKGDDRGLNAAVVDSRYFEIVSFKNFDTYLSNQSAEIHEWMNGISNNDIVIMFTHDDASAKLTEEVRSSINDLGSGKIQNLRLRSQWYMITQKGTQGFTIYEKLTYSKEKGWGDKIEFRGCVPRRIPKKQTSADEPLKQNKKRAQFCEGKQGDRYKGFCNEPRFEMIMPALLTNTSLLENDVYAMPIYLFASSNLEVFIAALNSLIHQPGIALSLITVLYKNNDADVTGLSKIYNVHHNKTTKFASSFGKKLLQVREIASKIYPAKKNLIVVDSDVIPSPDFLFFMAQMFPTAQRDDEVTVISGWSPNCYETQGGVHLAYRIRGIPRYAALIPVAGESHFYGEIFAPDVSRVQGPEICHLPSLDPYNWIERPQDLLKDRYSHKLIMLQQLSQLVEVSDVLESCSVTSIKYETNAIYLPFDYDVLSKLLKCLGVLNNQFGEYEGIIRLFVRGKTVLIITSNSPFYKSRPIASA